MMRIAGRLDATQRPVWAAWLASVASVTLAACVMPLADRGEVREAERRTQAYRHTQLALAYLGHARVDVASSEMVVALALAPSEASVRHAAALVAVAQGQRDAALDHFAAAVAAVDREYGLPGTADAPARANVSGPRAAFDVKMPTQVAHGAARMTLADARTLWSNYAQALCAAGKAAEAGHFLQRAAHFGGGASAAIRDNACPTTLGEAASQR